MKNLFSRIRSTVVFLTTLALAAVPTLGLVTFAAPVYAQDAYGAAANRVANGTLVTRGLSAVSTDALLLIRYVGSGSTGGTVTVAAGGDLTFSLGPVGSSSVDTTMECDASIAASGSRSGIYDLSTPDAQCDTLGEIVDLINQSSNWRAVILDGLRSDSTDNTLITRSEVAANSIDGVALLADGTTLFKQGLTVGNWACPVGLTGAATSCSNTRSMTFYIPGTTRTASTFYANPWAGKTRLLFRLTQVSTYGSGSSAISVNCVAATYRQGASSTSSETVSTYSIAAGATTVATTLDFGPYGIGCPQGQKMLLRTDNTAAMTAATLYYAGLVF